MDISSLHIIPGHCAHSMLHPMTWDSSSMVRLYLEISLGDHPTKKKNWWGLFTHLYMIYIYILDITIGYNRYTKTIFINITVSSYWI